MATAEITPAPGRRAILILTGTAIAAALVILFAGVLPAEYHRDPLGLGKLTGTAALWAPEVKVAQAPAATPGAAAAPASRSWPTPFRSDVIEIPIAASGDAARKDELEYKVRLQKGASLVYSWEAPGIANPTEFYTEFHGESTAAPGAEPTIAYYRKDTGTKDNGTLTAPFDGIHGWYFQNQSIKPVKIRLRLAGFYTLIPPGQPGNEVGLVAKPQG